MHIFDYPWVDDNAFQQILLRNGKYDDPHMYQKKMHIVNCLKKLYASWLTGELVSRQILAKPAAKINADIQLIGSFFMNVHDVRSDIDFLCITPPRIRHEYALQSFYAYLEHVQNVSELRTITSARVPIIKLKFDGVHINLSFANDEAAVKTDQKLVFNLHWKRCISTLKTTRSFPTDRNFQFALLGVRLWARNNKIYSSSMGFLGGIAWAILLYRIYKASHCNNNPITASEIVINFFTEYHNYNWKKHMVSFKYLETPAGARERPLKDETALMVVKTDLSNTSVNVGISSRKLIEKAIKRGFDTLRFRTWDDLFIPVPFFIYEHYVAISLKTQINEMDHLQKSEFVESSLRKLIESLDHLSIVELAHLNTERFQINLMNDMRHCTMWFIGLELKNTRDQIALEDRKWLNTELDYFVKTYIIKQMKKSINPSNDVNNDIHGRTSVRIGLMNYENLQKYLSPEQLRT